MLNPYLNLIKTSWIYASGQRIKFLTVYSLFIFKEATISVYPLLWGWLIDQLQKHPIKTLDLAWKYIMLYLCIKLIEWAIQGPVRVIEHQLSLSVSNNFLKSIYHKGLHFPMKWHKDHHSGDTISRINKAHSAIKYFTDEGFIHISAIFRFIFSTIAMIFFSPVYGSISVVLGIFTVWLLFQFDKPYAKSLNKINEIEHSISSNLFDGLSNIMTVIALRLQGSLENKLAKKVNELKGPVREAIIINEFKWFIAYLIMSIIYIILIIGYVYQNWVPGQIFYVGGLVTLLAFFNRFNGVFNDISWHYTMVIQYNTDLKSIDDIITDNRNLTESQLPQNVKVKWKRIRINNLCFTHHGTYDYKNKNASLHSINLALTRGSKIALIGESGCGKSTLLALLRGLYKPEEGISITFDDCEGTITSLNQIITLFPQEPEIFENTIIYNLTMGLEFGQEDLESACVVSQILETILRLPNGMNSIINEKGVNLSGGQKQRIALARGIISASESEILLLDEPTSSVDPKTERLIYQELFSRFPDKTIISAMHRLHFLNLFDYIYILQDGLIVGEGTYNQLKHSNQPFIELAQYQRETNRPI